MPCDVFITEATFGLPVFRHPDTRGEVRKLLDSVALFPERAHIVGAYALGKAQRVMALLREEGYDRPIYLHGAMERLTEFYKSEGIPLGETPKVVASERPKLAGAIVICGNCINQMVYGGENIASLQYLIMAYVILSTAVLAGPLLLLSVALTRARRRDLMRYDAMAQRLFQAFDAQWAGMASQPDQAMLDCPSPQTAADFSSVHDNIRNTAIVPINRWHLLRMLLSAALPFLPLAFIAMSVDELMARMLNVLV